MRSTTCSTSRSKRPQRGDRPVRARRPRRHAPGPPPAGGTAHRVARHGRVPPGDGRHRGPDRPVPVASEPARHPAGDRGALRPRGRPSARAPGRRRARRALPLRPRGGRAGARPARRHRLRLLVRCSTCSAATGWPTAPCASIPAATYEIGPFTIRFVPSRHSKLLAGLAVPSGGELTCESLDGLSSSAYRCGQVHGIHLRGRRHDDLPPGQRRPDRGRVHPRSGRPAPVLHRRTIGDPGLHAASAVDVRPPHGRAAPPGRLLPPDRCSDGPVAEHRRRRVRRRRASLRPRHGVAHARTVRAPRHGAPRLPEAARPRSTIGAMSEPATDQSTDRARLLDVVRSRALIQFDEPRELSSGELSRDFIDAKAGLVARRRTCASPARSSPTRSPQPASSGTPSAA